MSSYYDQKHIALYLMKNGADVHALDVSGRSPIHILCGKGNWDTFITVVEYQMHLLMKMLYTKVNSLKRQFGFKNSDVRKGKLVSSDQHVLEVQNKFREFSSKIHQIYEEYTEEKLEMIKRLFGIIDQKGCLPIHYAAQSKYQQYPRLDPFICHDELVRGI